jgi:hypothetical protein
MAKSVLSYLLCPSSTVVLHWAHNPKSEALKPTTGTGREKKRQKVCFYICCAPAEEWYNNGLIIINARYSNPPLTLGERFIKF